MCPGHFPNCLLLLPLVAESVYMISPSLLNINVFVLDDRFKMLKLPSWLFYWFVRADSDAHTFTATLAVVVTAAQLVK